MHLSSRRLAVMAILLLSPVLISPQAGGVSTPLASGAYPITNTPQFYSPTVNSTTVGGSARFSLVWTDSGGLSGFIFSYDAGSGVFINDSLMPIGGTVAWTNVSKSITAQIGQKVNWKVYAFDAMGGWSSSFTYCFVAGAAGALGTSYVTITDDCYDILGFDGQTLVNLANAPQLTTTGSSFTGYHEIAWNPAMTLALAVGYNNALVTYAPSRVVTPLATGLPSSYNLNSVAWSPDGSVALIAGDSGLLKYSNGVLAALRTPVATCCGKVRWSPSGQYAVALGTNGTILKYTSQTNDVTIVSTAYRNAFAGLGFSPDGSYALVTAAGIFFKLYASNSSLVKLSQNATVPITEEVEFANDGSYALVTAQSGGISNVLKWNRTAITPISSPIPNTANEITFSSGGSYALVTTTSGSLLRVAASSDAATLVPLTDTRLRGIDWYSPSGVRSTVSSSTTSTKSATTTTTATTTLTTTTTSSSSSGSSTTSTTATSKSTSTGLSSSAVASSTTSTSSLRTTTTGSLSSTASSTTRTTSTVPEFQTAGLLLAMLSAMLVVALKASRRPANTVFRKAYSPFETSNSFSLTEGRGRV